LWDVEKRKEKALCKIPATCIGLQFTANGKRLFASTNRPQEKESRQPEKGVPPGNEGWIVWFDTANLTEEGRQKGPAQLEKPWVETFAATPDGKLLTEVWWDTKAYVRQRFPVSNLRVYEADAAKEIAAPALQLTCQQSDFFIGRELSACRRRPTRHDSLGGPSALTSGSLRHWPRCNFLLAIPDREKNCEL
jgi:hypothetical protein